ncbi:MAG: minor capsid protein [Candidatus Methanomethylophilus sp.]|nr:minor capsid protein [Methanomethylophilus sp.]
MATKQRDIFKLARIQKKYESELLTCFRAFRDHALESLKRSRALETPRFLEPEFDLVNMHDDMERYREIDILQPSQSIIDKYDTQVFRKGAVVGERQLKAIGISIGLGVDTPIDQRVIQNLVARDISDLENISQEMSTQIMRELAEGNQLGESYSKMAARITGKWEEIGANRARTLVVTETQLAANTAARTRYEQAGIEYAEWLTADDERVSDQDINKNGIVFVLADGITIGALPGQGYVPEDSAVLPPSHPRCRCGIVPLTTAEVRRRGLIS